MTSYYDEKTYENIKARVLERMDNTLNKSEGSYINDMVSPYSLEIEEFYGEFPFLLGTMFLIDADSEELEKRGEEYGVIKKQPLSSKGFVMMNTKSGETTVKQYTQLRTETGLIFLVENDTLITTTPTKVLLVAENGGSRYNIPANTITRLIEVNPNILINHTEPTEGGTDLEKDEDLLNRIMDRIRRPSTGGNIHDFRNWALEVQGVGDAKVFPLWNGNGTVKVVAIDSNKRALDSVILQNVKDNIEAKKPIFGEVTVEGAKEVLINVDAVIKIEIGYTIERVIEAFKNVLNEYLKQSVLRKYFVDYYKVLSLFYDIDGVSELVSVKLNGETHSIKIPTDSIQVMNNINISIG